MTDLRRHSSDPVDLALDEEDGIRVVIGDGEFDRSACPGVPRCSNAMAI